MLYLKDLLKAIYQGSTQVYLTFVIIIVYLRPGLVGAHSKTGHSNQHDWFYQIVCGLSHLGCYPTGVAWDKGMTDVVAVDTVSQAIVYLSLNYCELYS